MRYGEIGEELDAKETTARWRKKREKNRRN